MSEGLSHFFGGLIRPAIISVVSETPSWAIPRTTVKVNGNFIYQSAHAVEVERENLKRLVAALPLLLVEVEEAPPVEEPPK